MAALLMPTQLTLEHVSPATRLLEKRRQMFEVQEALDAQKSEYKRREAEFKRREEKLKERDLALQESLIKFNKFLQENDSKRARAEKKERDEIKQRISKEGEITRLREQLEKLKVDKAEMLGVLHKDMRYQQYLEAVLDSTDEYPEILELLMRYETLEATHQDLVERSREGHSDQENQGAFNKRFHKEKVDEILEYNNQIAMLQHKYEAIVLHANRLQAETDRQLQESAEATLQLGQVLMACDNIFTRCMSTSHVTHKKVMANEADKDAAVEKLSLIKDYLGDLLIITKAYKPALALAQDISMAGGGPGLAGSPPFSLGAKSERVGSAANSKASVWRSTGGSQLLGPPGVHLTQLSASSASPGASSSAMENSGRS
ncbi:hypothetical protein T492DRAFT_1080469 [Pavlovales sp. CCMP2436]|nr:hypothetical protein T492DRAFT_1080469 [Pavlovales sp. CCMP2436]